MKRLLFAFLIISHVTLAQKNVADSLGNLIKAETDNSIKIDLYNKLVWYYIFNDQEQARKSMREVEAIAKLKGQEYGFNSLLNLQGVFYDIIGKSDSANMMFLKSLQYSREHHFAVHEEHTLNNLGMFNWNKGDNEKALDYYFQSLKLADRLGGKYDRKDATYNNIGLIYQDMELCYKAIKYHKLALAIRTKGKDEHGQALSYNNLGICYTKLHDAK